MSSVYRYDDVHELTRDTDRLVPWLISENLLGNFGGLCEECGEGLVKLRKDKSKADGYIWCCSRRKKGQCGKKISIRQKSWFAGSKLSLEKILKLTYYWTHQEKNYRSKFELIIGSDHTIVDWYNFCREVCQSVIIAVKLLVEKEKRLKLMKVNLERENTIAVNEWTESGFLVR